LRSAKPLPFADAVFGKNTDNPVRVVIIVAGIAVLRFDRFGILNRNYALSSSVLSISQVPGSKSLAERWPDEVD
jgi:hypothetical protein